MKISIRSKLLISMLSSIVLLSLSILIFSYYNINNLLKIEYKKRGLKIAQYVSKNLEEVIKTGNKTAIHSILANYFYPEQKEIKYIMVISPKGKRIDYYFTDKGIFSTIESRNLQLLSTKIREIKIKKGIIFDIPYPIRDGNIVHIGLEGLSINEKVKYVIRPIMFITIGILVIAIIISLTLSKLLSKPIFELIEATKFVRKGELDRKITIKTRDEIEELAYAFNEMVKELKKAREKIILARNELTQIYNGVPTPIRVVDNEYNIITQNEAMDKLVKVNTEEAIGKKCWELFKGPYCKTKECTLRLILEGKKKISREEIRITSDNRKIPCQGFGTPFRDTKGKIIGIIEIFFDISEKQKFIHELENKAKELQNNLKMQQAYTDILTSLNQIIELKTLLNDILIKVIHYTKSQLGVIYLFEEELKPIVSYALDIKRIPNFKLGEGIPGQCAQEKKLLMVSNVPSDYFRISSGTGERIPKYIVCLPIIFKNEVISILELASFDQFSEDTFKFLNIVANSLGVGIDHALTYQKAEKLAKELQEKNELLLSQNEELKAQGEELMALNEELKAQAEELAVQKKALEEKARQVKEANRLKSEFLSNMSHELRTPLNAILGMTKLLMAGVGGSITNKQLEYLKIIERNGENLLTLINDVLDLSKIEAGKVEITWNKIYLKEFIDEVLKSVKPLAEEKNLVLKSIFKEKVDYIITDQDKLRQILLNLLSNAIKFTEKGEVTVIVEEKEKNISISVKDTGIGIPEEAIDYIFDAFRQIDGSTTRRYSGTGLGLSIVKKLVELLGGEIKVKSKLSEGSIFTIVLPKEPIDKERLEKDLEEKIKTPIFTREISKVTHYIPKIKNRILIIDDDPVVIEELKVLLKKENYELLFAYTGEKGLEFIKTAKPDLIILDLMMPGINGFVILDSLQQDEEIKDIPVIILTAIDLTEKEKGKLPQNVKGILLKGQIDKTHLIKTIKDSLFLSITEARLGTQKISSTTSAKILIVEDNLDNLFLIKEALKDTNYIIYTAKNGIQAIEQAQKINPDLIIMDMLMPVMDGYEAVQRLRKYPHFKKIPIIGLTARAMRGDKEKVLAAGCDDYLSKPVDPFLLREKIEEWLKIKKERGY